MDEVHMLKKSLAGVFALVALLIPLAAHAAASIYTENLVYDDFDTLVFHPDPVAYWHVLNWGDAGPIEGSYGDSSSVTAESEDGVTFARLALYPDATPGNYTNTEISEQLTGSS